MGKHEKTTVNVDPLKKNGRTPAFYVLLMLPRFILSIHLSDLCKHTRRGTCGASMASGPVCFTSCPWRPGRSHDSSNMPLYIYIYILNGKLHTYMQHHNTRNTSSTILATIVNHMVKKNKKFGAICVERRLGRSLCLLRQYFLHKRKNDYGKHEKTTVNVDPLKKMDVTCSGGILCSSDVAPFHPLYPSLWFLQGFYIDSGLACLLSMQVYNMFLFFLIDVCNPGPVRPQKGIGTYTKLHKNTQRRECLKMENLCRH